MKFKNKKKRNDKIVFIIYLILLFCIISILFSFKFLLVIQNYFKDKDFIDKFNKNEENINLINDFPKYLHGNYSKKLIVQKAMEFAFTSYFNYCFNSDEIRPITKQCMNTYGFQSSLIESLEALLLLNLTNLYSIAKKRIKDGFQCNKMNSDLVRAEIFERGIASLIGAYILTNDKNLLKMADNCADSIINIDNKYYFPRSVLNFKNNKENDRSFENGTSIHEIISGIPEILALYKINRNEKYLKFVKDILSKLLNIYQKTGIIYGFYDSLTGLNKTNAAINKFDREYLFRIFSLCLKLDIDDPVLIKSFEKMIEINQNKNNHLITKRDEINFKKLLLDDFAFSAFSIRKYVKENLLSNEEALDIIISSFHQCYSKYGFTSFSVSNKAKLRKNNLQYSSFIGDWINTAGYLIHFNSAFLNESVFNIDGHQLYNSSNF